MVINDPSNNIIHAKNGITFLRLTSDVMNHISYLYPSLPKSSELNVRW